VFDFCVKKCQGKQVVRQRAHIKLNKWTGFDLLLQVEVYPPLRIETFLRTQFRQSSLNQNWRSFCAISALSISYPVIQTPAEFLLYLKCLLHKLQGLELLLTRCRRTPCFTGISPQNLTTSFMHETVVEDTGTGIGIGARN